MSWVRSRDSHIITVDDETFISDSRYMSVTPIIINRHYRRNQWERAGRYGLHIMLSLCLSFRFVSIIQKLESLWTLQVNGFYFNVLQKCEELCVDNCSCNLVISSLELAKAICIFADLHFYLLLSL